MEHATAPTPEITKESRAGSLVYEFHERENASVTDISSISSCFTVMIPKSDTEKNRMRIRRWMGRCRSGSNVGRFKSRTTTMM